MFPMVPYHALPKLHAEIKDELPPHLSECLGGLPGDHPDALRQRKDPTYFIRRELPPTPWPYREAARRRRDGRLSAAEPGETRHGCGSRPARRTTIDEEDVIRFDHAGRTFAIYRSPDDEYFATDGLCTHEQVHLADGLVMDNIIECPKHNGRFDYRTGEAKGAPVCVNLKTYPVKVEGGKLFLDVDG